VPVWQRLLQDLGEHESKHAAALAQVLLSVTAATWRS